jgi:hypothetical protein
MGKTDKVEYGSGRGSPARVNKVKPRAVSSPACVAGDQNAN